jgi:hypothetical protein
VRSFFYAKNVKGFEKKNNIFASTYLMVLRFDGGRFFDEELRRHNLMVVGEGCAHDLNAGLFLDHLW